MGMRAGGVAILVFSMLAGCAASDVGGLDDAPGRVRFTPERAFGAYLIGRYAARSGDLPTAAARLAEAARDSGLSEIANQAFAAAVLAGRPEAADLAERVPANPIAQLVLGDREALAGRWDRAEARYAGLPPQGFTLVLRPLLVAWAQAAQGQEAKAQATLQPLSAGPLRAVAALHGALIADLADDRAAAGRAYGIAQQEYGPLNLRLGVILASWQARQGRPEEARRLIGEMVGLNGEFAMARRALEEASARRDIARPADGIAEAYLTMASALDRPVRNEGSALLLRRALALRPDLTAARLLLAETQAAAHQVQLALDTLGPVAADDPLIAVVRLRQAGLQEQLGHEDEARQMLEGLAAAYPDRPEPLAQLGDLLRRKSRFAEAVGVYDRAIARVGTPSRSAWPLFYARGIAHERAGQWAEAEQDFQFALRLAPDQPSVLNYLGYAWAERGERLDQARAMIEKAVAAQPEEGAFIDSLGWVLLRLGDKEKALANLERAVELQPEDPTINGHLGDALAAVGRWREAEFQWRRALTLKPDAEEEKRISERLAQMATAAPAHPATVR